MKNSISRLSGLALTAFILSACGGGGGSDASSVPPVTTPTDNTAPVITIAGGQTTIDITQGDSFTQPTATANDAVDGNVTTDPELCIWCSACLRACPNEGRVFEDDVIVGLRVKLEGLCKERREPELFI